MSVVGRLGVAILLRQLDDGRRAQPAVEVIVQQGLRRAANGSGVRWPVIVGRIDAQP